MLKIEIINSNIKYVKDFDKEIIIVDAIENIFKENRMNITQKTTLKTKAGSIHWHLKQDKQKGVLEVTYWAPEDRLWLEIPSNRRSVWNEKAILNIANEFVKVFGGKVDLLHTFSSYIY